MSKSEFGLIEKSVSEKIANHFSERTKFVVGVSGGMDSMALLYALRQLNIQGLVVHINYGLRGEESDKDQELVEGMSFGWGFECCSVKLEPEDSNGENFQNWARKERYRVFEDLASEMNADAIAVAHHKDDQVETIMQKLFRGAGPETWTGMSEWDGKIFRPFLSLSKEELHDYCEKNAIPFRTDQSNYESKYARNFLRNEFSEKMNHLFPGWQENVLKLQDFGKLNENAINELAKTCFGKDSITVNAVKDLEKLVALSVVKKFIHQFTAVISKGIIEEVYNLLFTKPGTELVLSSNIKLIRDRDFIRVKFKDVDYEQQKLTRNELLDGIKVEYLDFQIGTEIESELYLDAENLKFPLTLRRWKPGDRIQPLGMTGSQKVSDHLTNRKVASSTREKSLILTSADGTIYAIIFDGKNEQIGTISEICKATESTKQYLSITSKKECMSFYLPKTVDCNGDTFKVFITKEEIEARVSLLGKKLDKDFEGKRPIFIGILNGAFIFLADIMRSVSIPCEVDFMKLSSYGDEKVSSGEVTELKEIDAKVKGRHVVLVEDIIDTGLSMKYIVDRMNSYDPASVSVVTLLHKKDATKYDVQIDYVGFEIPTKFVLGYGLDFAQEGRNLAQIYVLDS